MHFLPSIAPYKVAILPLVKKYHSEYARELKETLSKNFMCMYVNLVVLVRGIEEKMQLELHSVLL